MIMVGKFLEMRICQYFLILDDIYYKMQLEEDIWQKLNSVMLIIICYLTAMN